MHTNTNCVYSLHFPSQEEKEENEEAAAAAAAMKEENRNRMRLRWLLLYTFVIFNFCSGSSFARFHVRSFSSETVCMFLFFFFWRFSMTVVFPVFFLGPALSRHRTRVNVRTNERASVRALFIFILCPFWRKQHVVAATKHSFARLFGVVSARIFANATQKWNEVEKTLRRLLNFIRDLAFVLLHVCVLILFHC